MAGGRPHSSHVLRVALEPFAELQCPLYDAYSIEGILAVKVDMRGL